MITTITMFVFYLMTVIFTALPFFLIYLFIKRFKSNFKVKTQVPDGLDYKEEKKFEAIQNVKIYVYVVTIVFAFIALITFGSFSPFLSNILFGLFLFMIGLLVLGLASMFIGGFRR